MGAMKALIYNNGDTIVSIAETLEARVFGAKRLLLLDSFYIK